MATEFKEILLKRGLIAQSAAYTGPVGEVVMDTELFTLRVQNGKKPGGVLLSKEGHLHEIANVKGLQRELDLRAPLASPFFVGIPRVPTPAPGDSTSQIASTEFVSQGFLRNTGGLVTGNVDVDGYITLLQQPAGLDQAISARWSARLSSAKRAIDLATDQPLNASSAEENMLHGPARTVYASGNTTEASNFVNYVTPSIAGAVRVGAVVSGPGIREGSKVIEVATDGGSFWMDSPASSSTTTELTFVNDVNGVLVVDGITVLPGHRILLKEQASAAQNGIYVMVEPGADYLWTLRRATDSDTWEAVAGSFVAVRDGVANGESMWFCHSGDQGELGVTPNEWRMMSSPALARLAEIQPVPGTVPYYNESGEIKNLAFSSFAADTLLSYKSGTELREAIQAAPLASPVLTGTPTAPTPTVDAYDDRLSTTAFVKNVVAGEMPGNAATASKLATARTISVQGAVQGSALFDGTSDIVIETSAIPIGTAPGVYPVVTVDNYGRVTAGRALTSTDIPNLSWNKIQNDLPTTLGGYGIKDAVKKKDSVLFDFDPVTVSRSNGISWTGGTSVYSASVQVTAPGSSSLVVETPATGDVVVRAGSVDVVKVSGSEVVIRNGSTDIVRVVDSGVVIVGDLTISGTFSGNMGDVVIDGGTF